MVAPIVIWAALTAASALANRQAQAKVERAQDKAYNFAEIQRKKRQSEAEAAAGRTEAAYKDQPKKQAAEGDKLSEAFKAEQSDIAAALSPNNLVTPGATTDRVVGEELRQRTGTRRYTDKLSEALGQMRGVDQGMLGAGLESRNNAQDIQMAQSFIRGDEGVLGAKLQAAQGKGKGYATLGDILSLAATVYGGYALAAPGAAGAAGAGGTTAGNAAAGTIQTGHLTGMAAKAGPRFVPHF